MPIARKLRMWPESLVRLRAERMATATKCRRIALSLAAKPLSQWSARVRTLIDIALPADPTYTPRVGAASV